VATRGWQTRYLADTILLRRTIPDQLRSLSRWRVRISALGGTARIVRKLALRLCENRATGGASCRSSVSNSAVLPLSDWNWACEYVLEWSAERWIGICFRPAALSFQEHGGRSNQSSRLTAETSTLSGSVYQSNHTFLSVNFCYDANRNTRELYQRMVGNCRLLDHLLTQRAVR